MMIENSVFCRLAVRLWAMLVHAWPKSNLYRALDRFGGWMKRQSGHSAVCGLVAREGALPHAWRYSWTCRVLTVLVNIPCAFCRAIYRAGKGLFDGSAVCRALGAAGSMPCLLVGIFLAVMLMVPHDFWNNLYALAGAAGLTCLFALGSASRPGQRLDAERLGAWFVLFWGMAVFAFFTSLSWSLSVRFVGFYLTVFLLVLLTVSSVRTYEQLHLLTALAAAGAVVAALYGCYQGITGVEVVANQQDMYVNAGMPGRVYSFFDNPNNFAEVLVMLMPLIFALFLNAGTWQERAGWLLSFGVCGAALGFTLSRSSWLGTVLAAAVFLGFENWKLLPLAAVGALCCVPLLPDFIFRRLLTIVNTKDTSTNYRFAIYGASEILMRDHWLKGVGLGSDVLKETFQNYPPMFDGNYPIHTHNNYLQVWAEMGIFGLAAYLGALINQLKNGVQTFRNCRDKRLKRLAAGAISGLCGILLVSVAEYTWFYPRNMFIYWFIFAVILACGRCAHAAGHKA